MNIKAKAAAITVGLIVAAGVVAELLRAGVNALSTEELTNLIGAVFMGWLIYLMYKLVLCRLEYNESITKINEEIAAKKIGRAHV